MRPQRWSPDQQFVSQLMKDLTVGASPTRRDVKGVLGKLKRVEKMLNKNDAAFAGRIDQPNEL
jgi:hypothetical protein